MTATKKETKFDNEIFFVEDPKFYQELSKKVTDKQNIDDFNFIDAALQTGKVKIRQRDADWAIKTTSGRGDLKGKKGDFLLIDPYGNKLKVTGKNFVAVYEKVIE